MMSAPRDPPTTWISCGVLRAEMGQLLRQNKINGKFLFLDSLLHMLPEKLETVLTGALEKACSKGGLLVLVYGDCCPRMLDLAKRFRVGRVNVINCAQMLVGKTRYRELMHEQSFMLLPEWAQRWKEIFQIELGLSPEVARDFMSDSRRELVYLDTRLVPVPMAALAECAHYTGLSWRVEPVSLDGLLALLLEAQAAAKNGPPREKSF